MAAFIESTSLIGRFGFRVRTASRTLLVSAIASGPEAWIAIVAVVGTSPAALVGVLALSGWVLYARTVRANVLSIRRLEYVEAAYTLGASDLRIIARHILPNTLAPILVIGSSQVATMVLLESGLSFLGMGIQAPQPSWGLMLSEGRDYLSNAWWLATVPGMTISLVVLGANLLGDGLRDILDPHMRTRRT